MILKLTVMPLTTVLQKLGRHNKFNLYIISQRLCSVRLKNFKCPTFAELITVTGNLCSTFQFFRYDKNYY